MKKTALVLSLAMAGLFMLPSCVQQTYMITDNPVGTKTGEAKLRMFSANKDISIEAAAKNGKITKIGTVEMRTTYFILVFVKTVVTGE